MNKEVEPSFFSLWPASSSGPLFSLFFFLAVNLLKRIDDKEETCFVSFFFLKKGRTAMGTSHASTLPFTGSLYSEQVQMISGTSKNILEKKTCVAQQVLWDFSYIIADLVLLCNLWYSDCFPKWDKSWLFSLFLCGVERTRLHVHVYCSVASWTVRDPGCVV